MIVENSPVFGAASDGLLAAPYSINFNLDNEHSVPTDGSWQGDKKTAATLYIDNYDNNFSINISVGAKSTLVPAYCVGYVDIRGTMFVNIVADSSSSVNIRLYTDIIAETGFTARGNPPNTPVEVPFVAGGTINCGGSNTIAAMLHNTNNNILYIGCSNGLMVMVDPKTNKIIDAADTSSGGVSQILSMALHPSGNIIISYSAGYLKLFNPLTKVTSQSTLKAASQNIVTIACLPTGEIYYATDLGADSIYVTNITFTTNSLITASLAGYHKLLYVSDFNSIFLLTCGISVATMLLQKLNLTSVVNSCVMSAGGGGTTSMTPYMEYCSIYKRLYCVSSGRGVISYATLPSLDVSPNFTIVSNTNTGMTYCATTNYLFISGGTSPYLHGFNCMLNSLTDDVTNAITSAAKAVMCTVGDRSYVSSNSGHVISYFK